METVEQLLARLSPQARRELLSRLDGPVPRNTHPAAGRPANGQERRAPLSFGQRRIWFLHQLFPEDTSYHIGYLVDWPTAADYEVLAAALADLVARHDALRTCFPAVDGEPEQLVRDDFTVPLTVVDLPAGRTALERWAQDVTRQPFDLEKGPLLRIWWVQQPGQQPKLMLVVHHIMVDGWSLDLLLREFAALYRARVAGEEAALTPLTARYTDFTRWQRQLLDRGARAEQAEYWRRKLRGMEPLEVPTDQPRGRRSAHRGATFQFKVDDKLRDSMAALARAHNTTPFMVTLAGFLTLLHRYTGKDDVSVGTPVTNRDRSDFENLVGFFLNTVVLRVDLTDRPSFTELLGRVWRVVLDAQDNRDLPFEEVVAELMPDRDTGSLPLTPVLFAYNVRSSGPDAPRYHEVETGGSKAELTVLFEEMATGLYGQIEYDTSLFDPATPRRMAGHLCRLLTAAVADPTVPVSDLPLLTDAEVTELAAWNATEPAGLDVDFVSVPALLREQVVRTPAAVAVQAGSEALTYQELHDRASRLADRLRASGTAMGTPVGVLLDRSIDLVVALVGTLAAGAAYMPLDPALPDERLDFILADSGAGIVLTDTSQVDRVAGRELQVIALDGPEPAAGTPHSAPPPIGPDDTAYVIYTSGSTGRPKGVVNTHRGLANHMRWMADRYRPGTDDAILQKTPAGFDVSLWEFLLPLMSGARLVMTPPDGHRDPVLLADLVQQHGITMIHFVPSMLHSFLATADPARCTSLRQVLCSGEALPADLVQRYFDAGFRAGLDNLYGPTEAAIHVTFWACEPGRSTVPIGHPVWRTQAHVVDRNDKPLPVGVPGELWLGGVQVAKGYLRRPELTAAAFTPDPFATTPEATVFRTGDLVRRRPDGALEFLGRLDHQVKLRGYRIELGEIEAALLADERITEAVVLLREDLPAGPGLVGYLVADGEAPSSAELTAQLRRTLPAYMVPSLFVVVPSMPLSANGKIDRRAVAALAVKAQPMTQSRYVAPRGTTEQTVAVLFTELLGHERIGVNDDFFALGGHSLLAARLVALVRRDFAVELTLHDLFDNPTVAGVAASIEGISGAVH